MLDKVSTLFKDHPDLLTEFKFFLPEQHHAQADEHMERAKKAREVELKKSQEEQQHAQSGGADADQQQPVEFDHAISYVTTIKKRFQNEPETYKQFLEILHTYQKEQRGIKDVLEQVSTLFADHPDLLKEFTYFLPDAVQEQAKERLSRAAADAETRRMRRQQNIAQQQTYAQQQYAQQQQQQQQQQMHNQQFYAQQQQNQRMRQMQHQQQSQMAYPQQQQQQQQQQQHHHMQRQQQRRSNTNRNTTYNAGVERQFFDHVKETLNTQSRNGEAWNEFLKCLDMYAQEILSRGEMLQLVEDLFGKLTDLFEEFKRILSASGSSEVHHDDTWYAVPLSEIDFTRCRKCTPSYRALPRDYPTPICSERNQEEEKVLNNIWVSLPVGSEESYTFRHMRKNQYEEALFRTEDERFEIDMIMDSNLCTIRVLEPIVEEIELLKQAEVLTSINPVDGGGDNKGAGGQRFQYRLDRKTFRVMHLNSITRIYGDLGQEMLDLMFKNPAKTVPIVLKRLRQKDSEFRASHKNLNKRWKEIVATNYHKSLDHKSFYFKQNEKKNTSNRVLFLEIKEAWELKRRVEMGDDKVSPSDVVSARSEKSYKDYAIVETVGPGGAGGGRNVKKPKGKPGPKFNTSDDKAPTPYHERNDVVQPLHPQFSPFLLLDYENEQFAQRDAYKLLMFHIEKGQLSPSDKERMGRMWRDFLGPFFGLSSNWLYNASIAEDNSVPRDPIPPGALVSTSFGQGKITRFDVQNNKYHVDLPFGKAVLHPTSVLCSVLPIEYTERTQKYRNEHEDGIVVNDGSKVMVGTQALYLFLRLHHILVQRLCIAKKLAGEAEDAAFAAHQNLGGSRENYVQTSKEEIYNAYLSMLSESMLIDSSSGQFGGGGMNAAANLAARHDERVRLLLGNGSYELSTMDKLLANCQKHLQTMCHDEVLHNMIQIYRRHNALGNFLPAAMLAEAKHLTYDEVYTFHYGKNVAGDKMALHMHYIDTLHTDLEKMQYRQIAVKNAADALKRESGVDIDFDDSVEGMTEAEIERKKILSLTSKMRVAKKKKDAKRKRAHY